ncbi:MAG: hypothetical protein LBL58_08405 [Tannerellaceae bacterium]|jgi:hypothetical protein|nr:hypothetical protein [Tannerellaceae bacterium]
MEKEETPARVTASRDTPSPLIICMIEEFGCCIYFFKPLKTKHLYNKTIFFILHFFTSDTFVCNE